MKIDFYQHRLYIVLPGIIFGKNISRPVRMLFDTGATSTTFDISVLLDVEAKLCPTGPLELYTSSSKTVAREYVLNDFRIGSLKFGPIRVQGTVISPELEVDGMIGCDLLGDRKTIIDFPNGKLQIVKSKKRTIKRK